jgi:hypothetical protein
MRTLVQVCDRVTGDTIALAEAKVGTMDVPSAERGADIALGRAIKQVEVSGFIL